MLAFAGVLWARNCVMYFGLGLCRPIRLASPVCAPQKGGEFTSRRSFFFGVLVWFSPSTSAAAAEVTNLRPSAAVAAKYFINVCAAISLGGPWYIVVFALPSFVVLPSCVALPSSAPSVRRATNARSTVVSKKAWWALL